MDKRVDKLITPSWCRNDSKSRMVAVRTGNCPGLRDKVGERGGF